MQTLSAATIRRDALTVRELVEALRAVVSRHPALTDILVRGEVGGVARPPSGLLYFALKDATSQIPCVLFRAEAAALRFELREGIEVVVRGDADVFPPKGQAQLLVREVSPIGRGAFWLSFEQVRDRLAAEGLFAADRKRRVPALPQRIGLVTSEAGAAMHDVLAVLERRYPLAEVLVSPCLVQGPDAPLSIAGALARLAGRVDVAIVARGGGSAEDLWTFNDERVARAIAGFPAPVISAVGHETDVTIADFAADVRAPTPSAAAEIVAPDAGELRDRVRGAAASLEARAADAIRAGRERVTGLASRLRPQVVVQGVRDARQRLATTQGSLAREAVRSLTGIRFALRALAVRLDGVSPIATIARGFAVVTREDGGLVASVSAVLPGDDITVHVSDGDLDAVVEERRRKGT